MTIDTRTKAAWRKIYRQKRKKMPPGQHDAQSLAIANQALKLPIWEHEFYHLFMSIARLGEINTEFLLHILQGKDKHVVLSKSDFQNQNMQHYLLTDQTRLLTNSYGIPEPQNGIPIETTQLEIVFVPLLAADYLGNRLGYGMGFYDRFLAQCSADCLKIGLSYFEPESCVFPSESTDIRLNALVTPNSIIKFNHKFKDSTE